MPIRDEQKQQTHQALIHAVLKLSRQGRTFSSMSLREITGAVNLAPATFYRHFQNMDQLGLELIDHLGIYLKNTFANICKIALIDSSDHAARLQCLFDSIAEQPDFWAFFIHERSSGSPRIRQAIKREFDYLVEDTANTMRQISDFQHIQDEKQMIIFSEMFGHFCFCWALEWLYIQHDYEVNDRAHQQQLLQQKALIQLELIYLSICQYPIKKLP
jgi:TetR/AcrR family transcriptional regulator, fatty acid biosynthesis regulator